MAHDDVASYYSFLVDADLLKQVTNMYRQQDYSLCAYGAAEGFVLCAYMQQDV